MVKEKRPAVKVITLRQLMRGVPCEYGDGSISDADIRRHLLDLTRLGLEALRNKYGSPVSAKKYAFAVSCLLEYGVYLSKYEAIFRDPRFFEDYRRPTKAHFKKPTLYWQNWLRDVYSIKLYLPSPTLPDDHGRLSKSNPKTK